MDDFFSLILLLITLISATALLMAEFLGRSTLEKMREYLLKFDSEILSSPNIAIRAYLLSLWRLSDFFLTQAESRSRRTLWSSLFILFLVLLIIGIVTDTVLGFSLSPWDDYVDSLKKIGGFTEKDILESKISEIELAELKHFIGAASASHWGYLYTVFLGLFGASVNYILFKSVLRYVRGSAFNLSKVASFGMIFQTLYFALTSLLLVGIIVLAVISALSIPSFIPIFLHSPSMWDVLLLMAALYGLLTVVTFDLNWITGAAISACVPLLIFNFSLVVLVLFYPIRGLAIRLASRFIRFACNRPSGPFIFFATVLSSISTLVAAFIGLINWFAT